MNDFNWWTTCLGWRATILSAVAVGLAILCAGIPGSTSAASAIAVGDALQIDFLDDDADPLPLYVGGNGTAQLPYVGALVLAGHDLDGARDLIADLYITRGVFIAPQIELSFVDMRPLSVLGDVRDPGFYDYQTFVTVEQAIGLAGGIMRPVDSEEGRSMQRASLHGELARLDGDITREAVAAARLMTQLDDRPAMKADNVTVADFSAPDRALIETLVIQDNAIIAAERANFRAQSALLERAVRDARLQIRLTEEQIVAQEAQILSYDAELKSNSSLADRGLVAAPVRARLLRQVADEKTDLLRLRTNLASARLQLIGVERQELDLDYERRQTWRLALSESAVRAAQMRSGRDAVLDRLAVLDGWSTRMVGSEARLEISYLVRRRSPEGGYRTTTAAETDELSPGDVLIVRVVGAEERAASTTQVQP